VREAELVRHGETGEAVAEVPVKLLLGPEGQAPGVRVQAVGADDEIESTLRAAAERHIDPVRTLVEGRDAVVEPELHVVADRGVQDLGEVAPGDLDVPALDPADHDVRLDRGDHAAVGVQKREPLSVDVGLPQLRQDPHPPYDFQCSPANVDRIAAAADHARLLHDRDLEAVSPQPVRQCGTSDTGTRDEYPAHDLPPK
jgi:hypothetical protein